MTDVRTVWGAAAHEAEAQGWMERAGVDEDGDQMWRLTETGRARAYELGLEHGAKLKAAKPPTPLETCLASLARSRAELLRLLELAEQKARAAVAVDDPAERRRLLTEACDAEFEALFDCEASGGLAQALGVDPV